MDLQREYTLFETGSGNILVLHEMTLGDIILSTILLAVLIFNVLVKVIRR